MERKARVHSVVSLFQSYFGFSDLLIFFICSRLDFAADVMFYMHVNSARAPLTSTKVVVVILL